MLLVPPNLCKQRTHESTVGKKHCLAITVSCSPDTLVRNRRAQVLSRTQLAASLPTRHEFGRLGENDLVAVTISFFVVLCGCLGVA